jgi:hypothetical protein
VLFNFTIQPFNNQRGKRNEKDNEKTDTGRDAPCRRIVSLCSCPMRWLFGIMANIQDAETRNKADG